MQMPMQYQQQVQPYMQMHQQMLPHHRQQLQMFWQQQAQEVETATDFKNHQLPLARIKKIMKSDEDVRMISAEAPVLFAKACEMFILELTLRSWIHSEENKRRTLQRNDIAAAVTKTDIFDFLVDIVPREDLKDDGLGMQRTGMGVPGGADPSALYGGMYYMPQQMQADPNAVAGRPVQMDPAMLYRQSQGAPSQPGTMHFMGQGQIPGYGMPSGTSMGNQPSNQDGQG
mmetsp:Transcript_5316/g.33355  ORF Transcript_5316/g.33355 Transcript_5316/m.33355 type:complete len:229 (-) Transcript_5316:983-1669(-)